MNFINLAKEGLETYQRSQSQSDVSKTGGEEYNRPDHRQSSTSSTPDLDEDYTVKKASEQGSGESSLFSSALGFIKSNTDEQKKPVDEDEVQRAHDKAYKQGDTSGLSSQLLGGAAALQAFKLFTGSEKKDEKLASGGNTQSSLVSLAMAEASKLFDKSGGSASGNKQDAVNGAAMTVMKLLVQSKFSGTTGGKDSGGLSGLLSLASKFR